MDALERTDPEPPPTLAGTHASGGARPLGDVPTRGTEIGRYLVTGEIGRGAMGAVLAAYDADLDRKVAIKLIGERLDADEDRRHRLLGEAKSMARIAHPNVVTVYDAGVWHDRLWVAMELVDGVTLERWHAAQPRSIAEIVDTFVAAARGLAAAHDAGVLHGDFKPTNVLVAESGRVVVADFGLANPLESRRRSQSALDSPTGTPAYMSPEHFLGGEVDARADQFAFCVALFEQLTGSRPFTGRSLVELASAISSGTVAVASAATIPARVRAVVMRGLSSKPDDRFASMHELIAALESAMHPRWRWQLATVAASALVVALAWLLARDDAQSCVPGSARVQEIWNANSRAQVSVAGEGMTAAALTLRADHLRDGLDRYFGEWIELFDQACRDGAAQSVELGQRARMACLENRLDAGRGFVALLGDRTIEAGRVDPLLEALPELADCRGPAFGRWEPVPADPELAREVARIRLQLVDMRMRRRAFGAESVAPDVAALLVAARATGLSHVIAETLLEHAAVARTLEDPDAAAAAVEEALDLALRDGHDLLASRAINRRLLLMQEDSKVRLVEGIEWARVGEALATRAGASPRHLGDFANNLSILARHQGDTVRALDECRRAEQLYAAELGPDARSTVGARVNCATVLAMHGELDEAYEILIDASAKYDEMLGREHADAITVVWNVAQLHTLRGERAEALAWGRDAVDRRVAATGPRGRAARSALTKLAQLQAASGDLVGAHDSLARARAATPNDDADGDEEALFVEATVAAQAGEDERALALFGRFIAAAQLPPMRVRGLLSRAQLRLAIGDDVGSLADADEACGNGMSSAIELAALGCYAYGGLAAIGAGDRLAATRFLAWAESVTVTDREDELLRGLLRFAMSGHRDAASLARIRDDRDALARRGHERHPSVRIFDRWLATTQPGVNAVVQ